MYTVILLQRPDSEHIYMNDGTKKIHAFLIGSGLDMYLGSFTPDSFNGNPYKHLDHVQKLGQDRDVYLTLDNTSLMVYGLLSGDHERLGEATNERL